MLFYHLKDRDNLSQDFRIKDAAQRVHSFYKNKEVLPQTLLRAPPKELERNYAENALSYYFKAWLIIERNDNMPQHDWLPGLAELQARTKGSSDIRVAVLDGIVDTDHPCFTGASLSHLPTLALGKATTGAMSTHGTHVASLIFGQPHTEAPGIAPNCRGILAPVFSVDHQKLSQLDLARAIEQAAEAGAHIINISGGALTDIGEAEDWLDRAVKMCRERNILIVAAAGNDGCDCLNVPAALPAVLAVGAVDARGHPLNFSNWGETYQSQGILAPGENIPGASPGDGIVLLSGTSFAAPIVSGVVALLLSLQAQRGEHPNTKAVRDAILASAQPCSLAETEHNRKCLVGILNIPGAIQQLTGEIMSDVRSETLEPALVEASGCSCGGSPPVEENTATTQPERAVVTASPAEPPANPMTSSGTPMPDSTSAFITPSEAVEPANGMVYAIGTLGYDFGTEARRDTFKQLMPPYAIEGTQIPANPYDARQMVDYLGEHLSETKSLIWTLNLELTPVYAIQPAGSFSREVYAVIQELLSGQVAAEDSTDYVERVSIPGLITGRTVRLFSGQVVPVIEPQSLAGCTAGTSTP